MLCETPNGPTLICKLFRGSCVVELRSRFMQYRILLFVDRIHVNTESATLHKFRPFVTACFLPCEL